MLRRGPGTRGLGMNLCASCRGLRTHLLLLQIAAAEDSAAVVGHSGLAAKLEDSFGVTFEQADQAGLERLQWYGGICTH